jgi:hypothetical protein
MQPVFSRLARWWPAPTAPSAAPWRRYLGGMADGEPPVVSGVAVSEGDDEGDRLLGEVMPPPGLG